MNVIQKTIGIMGQRGGNTYQNRMILHVRKDGLCTHIRRVVDELCSEERQRYLGLNGEQRNTLNGCGEQMQVNRKWSIDMYTYIACEEDTT